MRLEKRPKYIQEPPPTATWLQPSGVQENHTRGAAFQTLGFRVSFPCSIVKPSFGAVQVAVSVQGAVLFLRNAAGSNLASSPWISLNPPNRETRTPAFSVSR